MTISILNDAVAAKGGQQIHLSSLFSFSPSTKNPAYLVLTGLDRNVYTADATGLTGSLKAKNGLSESFSPIGGDARGIGMLFTLEQATGRYVNSTYGYFDEITYTASSSLNAFTNFSVYTTHSANHLSAHVINNAFLMGYTKFSGANYVGSVSISTQSAFIGSVPSQATPDSICETAQKFIGKTWNDDGCWVLASTIATLSGTSLPVDSSWVGLSAQGTDEWLIAFDGRKTPDGDWKSLVKAGQMIVIGNDTGLAHITTCVAGAGNSAMLLDNAKFVNQHGKILNAANNGSDDIVIGSPYLASRIFDTVSTRDVKIYQLNTPTVSTVAPVEKLTLRNKDNLDKIFTANDPEGKQITQFQIFDTADGTAFKFNNQTYWSNSAETALTVQSLAQVSIHVGANVKSNTIEVRAFNGQYWGDWESVDFYATPQLIGIPPLLQGTGVILG